MFCFISLKTKKYLYQLGRLHNLAYVSCYLKCGQFNQLYDPKLFWRKSCVVILGLKMEWRWTYIISIYTGGEKLLTTFKLDSVIQLVRFFFSIPTQIMTISGFRVRIKNVTHTHTHKYCITVTYFFTKFFVLSVLLSTNFWAVFHSCLEGLEIPSFNGSETVTGVTSVAWLKEWR